MSGRRAAAAASTPAPFLPSCEHTQLAPFPRLSSLARHAFPLAFLLNKHLHSCAAFSAVVTRAPPSSIGRALTAQTARQKVRQTERVSGLQRERQRERKRKSERDTAAATLESLPRTVTRYAGGKRQGRDTESWWASCLRLSATEAELERGRNERENGWNERTEKTDGARDGWSVNGATEQEEGEQGRRARNAMERATSTARRLGGVGLKAPGEKVACRGWELMGESEATLLASTGLRLCVCDESSTPFDNETKTLQASVKPSLHPFLSLVAAGACALSGSSPGG
eukprot:3940472-Rhodomonas_salina.1